MSQRKAIGVFLGVLVCTVLAQTHLRLNIEKRPDDSSVEVTFYSEQGKTYRLEESQDLDQFTPVETVNGTGEPITYLIPVDENHQFFRVRETPSAMEAQELISVGDYLQLESPPPDYQIAYDSGQLQFGKLRLPEGGGPHPVVIFLHGGCWLSQFDIEHTGPLEQAIADEGYAVWSIEYRRVGDEGGGWPGTFHDVGKGADYLRMVASLYDLDLAKVVASGHSSGGHLALWLAARSSLSEDSELYAAEPLTIHGVFALAPAPDLAGLYESRVCGHVIDGLMGGSPDEFPGRYGDASPMRLAPIDVPQTLIIGTRDQAWAPVGRAYFERAVAAGDTRVRVVEAKESGHFEMIVPTTSSWPVVRDALSAMFRELEN